MKYKYFFLLVLLFIITLSCKSIQPAATDRKQDILFLAQWAQDYSPFIELNKKFKKCPDYDTLKYRYLELVEKAKNDEEFFQIVNGYFRLIGICGHASILLGNELDYIYSQRIVFQRRKIMQILSKKLDLARLLDKTQMAAGPRISLRFLSGCRSAGLFSCWKRIY